MYVLGGTAAELRMRPPGGKYRAEWIDTKTGDLAGAEQFDHAGGVRKLAAPAYQEDIALRIIAR